MKTKAINANREIRNRLFSKFMLTVEVDMPKTVYEVFAEIATKQYAECEYPPPPEIIMQNYLMDFAEEYIKENQKKEVKEELDKEYEPIANVIQARELNTTNVMYG